MTVSFDLTDTADGETTTSTEVYAENNDLNVSSPRLHLYPDLAWGNHYFTVYWTGETGYGGRGLYVAYYSLNYDFLAQAYLIQPQSTQQSGTAEGYLGNTSGYCPKFVNGCFGTSGDISNPSWNSSTELYIDTNQPQFVPWTPANIETSSATDSPPYLIQTFNDYDAYNAYGGGP